MKFKASIRDMILVAFVILTTAALWGLAEKVDRPSVCTHAAR